MDDQLKQAWLKGDAFSLELMLSDKNVMDCIGLFQYLPDNIFGRLAVAKVLLEACIRQKIDSFVLEKLGAYCRAMAEYGWNHHGYDNELWDVASCAIEKATKQLCINKDNCRKVIVTLLGCCGKQRRAEGGILKDVVPIIAKQVWKTRRKDLWK